jgi:hypothetical protein
MFSLSNSPEIILILLKILKKFFLSWKFYKMTAN